MTNDIMLALGIGIICGIVAGMAIMAAVGMAAVTDEDGGEGKMHDYMKGDIVQLKNSNRKILVLEVFPENTGVWALYYNSYGAISARGYNRVFLGEVVGQVSIDRIEGALRSD